ncbi:MAG TPA: DUF1326 domain-containing protein [Bryobacteraceae bacterium]|jgi:hypothetical protein
MKTLVTLFAVSALAAFAADATLPDHAPDLKKNSIRGNYIEARTADVYTGPCFAMSEINLTGDLGIFGWQIEHGSFDGVRLDGLSVVGVLHASATLGDPTTSAYPVQSVLIVDQKADLEQRLALRKFAQRMAGGLLNGIVRVEVQPIQFAFENNNVHTRNATLTAGTLATIKTRALASGDQICHNETTWYPPLTEVDHAMPAYTETNMFHGQGLNTTWNYSQKRGSFVGTFHLDE